MKLSALLKVALLASLATILMSFSFSIGLPYLKYDASEVPALIAGFAIDPLAGAAVVILKNMMYLTTHYQPQEMLGIPINTIAGLTFVLVACNIYHVRKTKSSAKVSLLLGAVAMTLVMIPVGMLLMPVFQRFFTPEAAPMTPEALVRFLLLITVPFNIFKGALTSVLTFFTYKRFSRILKSEKLWDEERPRRKKGYSGPR